MANVKENLQPIQWEDNAVIEKLNNSVFQVLGNDSLQGFQKAYAMAAAIEQIKLLLTPEYMRPIMQLQGNRLGFKTDKDKDGGYPEAVVKNCLVEAVLMGVQPYGNQFNIIAGNTYITKEGFTSLLLKMPGLTYSIVPQLPRVKDQSAAVVMEITWTLGSQTQTKNIDFGIKLNQYMGVDGVIGKAHRKARAWLFNQINGVEIPEGEVTDHEVLNTRMNPSKAQNQSEKEQARISNYILNATTVEQLEEIFAIVPDELMETYLQKKEFLTPKMPV